MPLPPRSRDASHRLPSARAERDVRYREELTAGGTGAGRGTIGADKGYNQRAVVGGIREAGKTPHVAAKASGNAIDGRTTRHAGYAVSQRLRKRVEEIFGWMKTVGLLRKLRHRGVRRVAWTLTFTAAVYNLVRMRRLLVS